MDNQHQKIKGYRELSVEEIALMNEIKAKSEELGALFDRMDRMPNPVPVDHPVRPAITVDKRWLAIARTQVQQGIMAWVRSVAQPTTF